MEEMQRIETILNYIDRRLQGATIPGQELSDDIIAFYCQGRQFWSFKKDEILRDQKITNHYGSENLLKVLG